MAAGERSVEGKRVVDCKRKKRKERERKREMFG